MSDATEAAPDVLADLMARLAAATGSDRELDARIHAEFSGWDVRPLPERPDCIIPRYTISVDAALMLVPDQREWHMVASRERDLTGDRVMEFLFEIEGIDGRHAWQSVGADTAALAVCLGALKLKRSEKAP